MGGFLLRQTFDFYKAATIGIVIIRVLHGARDIDRILEEETYP